MSSSVVALQGDTVRLLTCSQVITSIQCVVKELVENALDAKASSISIRLENYGLDVIEVKDNGSGVREEDARCMALPHSTSKITSFSDLCTLETYGFRGEALHSMAMMGSLSVTTRTEGDTVARKYSFTSDGDVASVTPAALERGTKVTVTDLFKRFPVRRQRYKSQKCSKEQIKRVEHDLLAFGLAHPEVYFLLRHNKHTLWQKPVASKFEANIQNILGTAIFQQMLPLSYHCFNPMLKIQAFVPKAGGDGKAPTRSTSEGVFLLVNKRPVVMKSLVQLVKQAFSEAFPTHSSCHPVAVLSLTVLPQAMDVNLEPNKTSVLLHDMDFILSTLRSLLEQVYSPFRLRPQENVVRDTTTEVEGAGMREEVEGTGMVEGAGVREEEGTNVREEVEGMRKVMELERSEETDPREVSCVRDGEEGAGVDKAEELEVAAEELEVAAEGLGAETDVRKVEASGQVKETDLSGPIPGPSDLTSDLSDLTYDPSDLTSDLLLEDLMSEGEDSGSQSSLPVPRTCEGGPPSPPAQEAASPTLLPPASTHALPLHAIPSQSQPTLSQWSRGRIGVKQVEPVRVCAPKASLAPPTKPHSSSQKLFPLKRSSPIFDMINSRPVKRRSPVLPPASTKRQKTLPPMEGGSGTSALALAKETRPGASSGWCTADAEVDFDLAAVTRRQELLNRGGDLADIPQVTDRVIGMCPHSKQGVWLVVHDAAIACFDMARAKERLAEDSTSLESSSSCGEGEKEVKSVLNQIITATDRHQFFHPFHQL